MLLEVRLYFVSFLQKFSQLSALASWRILPKRPWNTKNTSSRFCKQVVFGALTGPTARFLLQYSYTCAHLRQVGLYEARIPLRVVFRSKTRAFVKLPQIASFSSPTEVLSSSVLLFFFVLIKPFFQSLAHHCVQANNRPFLLYHHERFVNSLRFIGTD